MNKTSFVTDIQKGNVAETIFEIDFLKFLHIPYRRVCDDILYRKKDIDFILDYGMTIEVKNNYKDDSYFIFEECSSSPEIFDGWIYTSEADMFVFLSEKTREMYFFQNNTIFKNWWLLVRNKFPLFLNKISYRPDGSTWQSAFRKIHVSDIFPFLSISQYKKYGTR